MKIQHTRHKLPVVMVSLTAFFAAHGVQAEEQGDSTEDKGFFAGDSLSILNRNFYFSRDYRDQSDFWRYFSRDFPRLANVLDQSYREEWAHGLLVEYKSGYTDGVVGFGIDTQAYAGVKLDSGFHRNNRRSSYWFTLIPVNDRGEEEDAFGEIGGSAKARISSTELRYGEMRTAAPVFGTGDGYLMPETATGFHVSSSEIEGLSVELGHFTAYNNFASTNSDDELLLNYGSGQLGGYMDFAGGSYTVSDNLSLMLYASHLDETWYQYFGNVNYAIPLGEKQKLTFDGILYQTDDTGDSYQGAIDNTAYSIKASYELDVHTVELAYQKIDGDTPFDYVGFDSIWLANSNQFADFNAPEEQSVSLAYIVDLAELVIPGLTAKVKYTTGDNIDGTKADPTGGYHEYYGPNGKHWEQDFDLKYVVQSGTAKDLSIRIRQATHRANTDQGDRDVNEVRVIIEYPYSL